MTTVESTVVVHRGHPAYLRDGTLVKDCSVSVDGERIFYYGLAHIGNRWYITYRDTLDGIRTSVGYHIRKEALDQLLRYWSIDKSKEA